MVNANFENITLNYKNKIGEKQIVLECNIDTAGNGGITKLLALSSAIKSVSCEVAEDMIKLNGRLAVKLCYIDGNSKPNSLDYNCDFLDSLELTEFEGELFCKAKIADSQRSIVNNEIKLQTVITIDCYAVAKQSNECLIDTDVIPLKRDKTMPSLCCFYSDNLTVSEGFEGKQITQALMANTQAIVTSTQCESGKVIVDGKCFANIIYTSEGELLTKNIVIAFNHQIENSNVTVDCFATAEVLIEDTKILLDDSKDDNSLTVEAVLRIKGEIYNSISHTIVSDVFCPTCELSTQTANYNYISACARGEYEEKIVGNISIDQDKQSIRRILSSCVCRVGVANAVALNKAVLVEGALLVNVIYEDEDGEIESIALELPYSVECRDERVNAEDKIDADAITVDLFARVRRDRELEVSATIAISYEVSYQCNAEVITSLEEVGERTSDLKGIGVYIVSEGESLWNVAKALGTPIETIIEQNPNLDRDIKGGERIMVYREI